LNSQPVSPAHPHAQDYHGERLGSGCAFSTHEQAPKELSTRKICKQQACQVQPELFTGILLRKG